MMDLETGGIPLAEMIQTLRRELETARERAKGEDIGFEMEKVELELVVALSRKTKGEGGVEFWVVKAGGEIEKSGATTHRFKLTLTPVAHGKRLKVSAEDSEKLSRK
jgi:Trypsin-co-occurring domain 2